MRVLYVDIDCLRPDHLGCYGYHRNTSPNIDAVAGRGVRCTNYYVSDAPCLPSRTALFTGRLGIHTGVVNHGGLEGDIRPVGAERGFNNNAGPYRSWMTALRQAGLYTCTVSPFAGRHAAWHFLDGFREVHDTGRQGHETADEIFPVAAKWLTEHSDEENWFLHVNFWDPHTPYRTPAAYGNPFEHDPAPSWLTEEIISQHGKGFGPHSALDLWEYGPYDTEKWPRAPRDISSLADFKKWIDGYDTGIRYADDHVGRLLNVLADKGVLEDTLVIVSADHGENQGEFNVYGDHQTADQHTCNVPLVAAGPGVVSGHVDDSIHYQIDLAPTVLEIVGDEQTSAKVEKWDGTSFLPVLRQGEPCGRPFAVTSQCAWSCQRGVRWDRWMLLRTYHDGLKDFDDVALFDLVQDPHETRDLSSEHPELVAQGIRYLEQWSSDMMLSSDYATDPMWHVIREGGPLHTRGHLMPYVERLRSTGRTEAAERLLQRSYRRQTL